MFFKEGIYKFHKPLEWTSFDVVNWVRHRTSEKRVGHAGTLDPAAEGLLMIAVGRLFTKNIESIAGQEKEYIFEITLGITTDTYDREGAIVTKTDNFSVSQEQFLEVLQSFQGEQSQIPPMYSAVKKNGQRLYDLARKGIVVERAAKTITIKEIECLDFNGVTGNVRIVCSKGTYVRSLCYNIGEKLGCGAFMSKLIRTRIGIYKLDDQCFIPVSGEAA